MKSPALFAIMLLAVVGCGKRQSEPTVAEYYDSDGNITAVERYGRRLSAEELKSYKSHFAGIGAVITTNTSGLLVKEVPHNSPAYHAGLLPQDLIVEVDGESTTGMNLVDAVNALRGNPNTKVQVSIERPGTEGRIAVEITRAGLYSWRDKSEKVQP
jgi:C-terminal processing protease CtpA/Prc